MGHRSSKGLRGLPEGLIIGGGSGWGRNTQVLFLQQSILFDNNSIGSYKSDILMLLILIVG